MKSKSIESRKCRRGFTLLVTLCILALLLASWASASRVVGSMVAMEASRADRVKKDSSRTYVLSALEKALAHLQNGLPETRKTYIYTVDLGLVDKSAHNYYTVRFDPNDSLRGTSSGWQVRVTPGLAPSSLALPAPQEEEQWPDSPP